MKTLLIAGLILLMNVASAIAQPFPFQRQPGLGKDRENLTPELIEIRAAALRKASEFWLLRPPEAQDVPNRIFGEELWNIIQVAAAEHEVDPFIIAALCFVESFCKPDAVSRTGPRGILQFTKDKGEAFGLKKHYETQRVKVTKHKGRGKKRRSYFVWEKRTVLVQDDRFVPALAIPAGARSLRTAYRIFGRWDFAIQEHHNGYGRVRRMVALYLGLKPDDVTDENVGELIAKHNLTYPQIFFDNTPYHRSALYQYLERIKKEADYAPTYSFRILQAADLLRTYVENSTSYEALLTSYKTRFRENGYSPNRMWYFYDPEEFKKLQFADLVAIQEANKSGRLVPLPEPWNAYGYDVRLTGASPIGEKDLANQKEYIQAEPATVGMTIALMHEVKELDEEWFKPYEINSLVRTDITQDDIADDPNSQASRVLPVHTVGKAVDFPIKGMKPRRLNNLLFVLADMDSNGMISYVLEHQTNVSKNCRGKGKRRRCKTTTSRVLATIHVVPHPQWEPYFTLVYRQATGKTEEKTINTQ